MGGYILDDEGLETQLRLLDEEMDTYERIGINQRHALLKRKFIYLYTNDKI